MFTHSSGGGGYAPFLIAIVVRNTTLCVPFQLACSIMVCISNAVIVQGARSSPNKFWGISYEI